MPPAAVRSRGRSAGRFFGRGRLSAALPPPLSCCPALRGRARAPERGARTLHGAPPPLAEEMPNFPLPPRRRRARSRAGGGGAGARRSGHRGGPAAASAAPPPRPGPALSSPRCPGRCCCSAWPSGRLCAPPGEHPAGRGAPRSLPQFPRRGDFGGGRRAPCPRPLHPARPRGSAPRPGDALHFGSPLCVPRSEGTPRFQHPVSSTPPPPRRPNAAGG